MPDLESGGRGLKSPTQTKNHDLEKDVNTVLTAAGIALCTTLLGNPNPSFNDCEVVIYRSQPPADYFFKSPVLSESCPDDRQDCEAKNWPNCIAWATYDILDGSKGTM